jgi:hypothetical protein
MLSVQIGFNPMSGEPILPFPALDLETKKLEATRNVHNPGFVPVESHAKLCEDLAGTGQGVFGLSSCPTGHNPIICPSRKLVSLLPHLFVKGS